MIASYRNVFLVILTAVLFSSCSLLKIESEQQPLSKRELNTRLTTQAFAKAAAVKVEQMADSIIGLSRDIETQKAAYLWKINTVQGFGQTAFQTTPQLSLLDTWLAVQQVANYMQTQAAADVFKAQYPLALSVSEENVNDISRRAKGVMAAKDYEDLKAFVESYAVQNPISNLDFTPVSMRETYFQHLDVPDSLAVQTVGSLSEVMSDFSSRLSYSTDATVKDLSWGTELYLVEKGFDTMSIKEQMKAIDARFDRLVKAAQKLPGDFQVALRGLQYQMRQTVVSIDTALNGTYRFVARERVMIDSMLLRERIALDTIVAREREAIAGHAVTLTESLMDDLGKIIRSILFYVIILAIIIFAFPFFAGFYLGKFYVRKKERDKG
ncbi:hypothetical protein [Robertkochia sediminum]|uniref:hypothetical protein n=1 Tax=Robertkochia sediminum TaxID=2785326 RepID=UPI001932B505|nr:hypothetical protein [Robertkochia sediminum]MBL7472702.1 hypothetical protein [Robertkochia sediminum]